MAISMAVMGAAVCFSPEAQATNGYFVYGFGPTAKGMAGAGVAYSNDSLAAATNPAGMAGVGKRLDFDLTLFNPNRSLQGVPAGAITNTKTDSLETLFEIPNFGLNYPIDDKSSIGFTMHAAGGMNTEWPIQVFSAFNSAAGAATQPTGLDLAQAFMGITYARKITPNHSIGITPTVAFQRFKAYGIGPFKGISADSGSLTDNGYDHSIGYGVRIGYQGKFFDKLTFGAAWQSRMLMTEFTKYSGLFAEQGDFDIPQTFTAGLAFEATPNLTLAFDWQWINYNQVNAISNSAGIVTVQIPNEKLLGQDNGVGFGWEDMNVLKFGANFRPMDKLTLSGGVSWNDRNPFDADQVLFNILAPGVVRVHLTFGASYAFSESASINISYAHAFSETFRGNDPNIGTQEVDLQMDQNEGTIGFTYRF